MPRFYFDIHDADGLYPDEEGLELPDVRAAELEAMQSLTQLARDRLPDRSDKHPVAIEVRTPGGPLFQATFVFGLAPLKQ